VRGSVRILDSDGKTLFDSLTPAEEVLFEQGVSGPITSERGRVRCGFLTDARGTVFLVSADPDLIRSGRLFRSYLDIILDVQVYLLESIAAVEERLTSNSKRLVHNLTSLNGLMIQEIYSVLSQDRLAGNIRRSIPLIESEMRGIRATAFAKCFLNLAKHSAAMKNEFSVFKKIGSLEAAIEKRAHTVHKVIMNAAYLFFSDFADKGGYVDVAHSEVRAMMDYECAFVALYHLFDNAAKYICPNTNVEVVASKDGDYVNITFSMCSLAISPDEHDKLVMEGFSGAVPRRLQLNGDGVGLSVVKKVMDLHSGTLWIMSTEESKFMSDGIEFQSNSFVLSFPTA
jgi:signal transduction histidine kinase